MGTDHAYLIEHLITLGKCQKGIACDINEKPLESARTTLSRAGISDKVQLILSDGLDNVPSDNITDVIMAGMGGELICNIISRAKWLENGANLILQPMTKAYVLRKWLAQNGFSVTAEMAANDGAFSYAVISCKYSGKCWTPDEFYAQTGALDFSDIEARKYLRRQADRLKKVGEGILGSETGDKEIGKEKLQIANKIYERLGTE